MLRHLNSHGISCRVSVHVRPFKIPFLSYWGTQPKVTHSLPTCKQDSQLQAVWQDALSQIKTVLKEDEYAKVVSIGCLEDLTAQIWHLCERYKRRRVSRVLRRMDQFFMELGRFSHVINMYVQADTKISALVFGTTYMILEVRHVFGLSYYALRRNPSHMNCIE